MKKKKLMLVILFIFFFSFIPFVFNVSSVDTIYPAIQDAGASENHVSYNFGGSSSFRVQSYSNADRRTFIKFSTSSIPSDAIIVSAILNITCYSTTGVVTGRNISAYRITHSWVEGDKDGVGGYDVSWRYYNYPYEWSSMGGDYDNSKTWAYAIIPGGGTPFNLTYNITDLVQNWVNGTYTNYGILLRDTDEDNVGQKLFNFYSSEADPDYYDYPPNITIVFTSDVEALDPVAVGSDYAVLKGFNPVSGTAGFYVNTSDTVGPSNYLYNISAGAIGDNINYTYNKTGLTPGQFYYYRAWAIQGGFSYSSNYIKFVCKPEAVTSQNATTGGASKINLSWVKGTGSSKTIIVMNTTHQPANIDDGTQIYNDTGTSYSYTYSLADTLYYFAFYSYIINDTTSAQGSPVYDTAFTLSDNTPPVVTVQVTANSGFDTDETGLINVTVWDNFGGGIDVNITVNGEYFNETVPGSSGTTSDFSFNLSSNGNNSIYVIGTDASNNSFHYNTTYVIYYVNFTIVNERTNIAFNWTNAKDNGNLTMANISIPGKNITKDIYYDENITLTYISTSNDILRFTFWYENTGSPIIRDFNMALLDSNSKIGMVEEETLFAEQLIYGTTVRPVVVKNAITNCFIMTGYTNRAYSDYYSIRAITIDNLYYLYTVSNGTRVYLASLEGSSASNVNLEFLAYTNLSYDLTILSDQVIVNDVGNTTIQIYYVNLENDNQYLQFYIYDDTNLIFTHTETTNPNEIMVYFDYSTINITEDMLKLKIVVYKQDGTSETIERYFSKTGAVGMLTAALGAIISISMAIFGLTLASYRNVLGYFGLLVMGIAIGITSLAAYEWYITLIQAVELVLMVIILLIYKIENPNMV